MIKQSPVEGKGRETGRPEKSIGKSKDLTDKAHGKPV
jgi:hypothetical protein